MRAPASLAVALVAVLALAGCNTVSGAGKDVSSTGKAITKTAEEVKN
jgi:predicted small secreted protein